MVKKFVNIFKKKRKFYGILKQLGARYWVRGTGLYEFSMVRARFLRVIGMYR